MKPNELKIYTPVKIEVRELCSTSFMIAAPYHIVDGDYGKVYRIVLLNGDISTIREDEMVSVSTCKMDAAEKKSIVSLAKMHGKRMATALKHQEIEKKINDDIVEMTNEMKRQFESMDPKEFVKEVNTILENKVDKNVSVGFHKSTIGSEFVLILDSLEIKKHKKLDDYAFVEKDVDDARYIDTESEEYKKAVAEFAPSEKDKLSKMASRISTGISIVGESLKAERIYSVQLPNGFSKKTLKEMEEAFA